MNKFEKISSGQFMTDMMANKNYHITKDYMLWDYEKHVNIDLGRIYNSIKLPVRATGRSAGYDFFIPATITIFAGEQADCLTGVKCRLDDNAVLLIDIRSSMGIKRGLSIANTIGVIDADYYNNPVNEGHIHIVLKNNSDTDVTLEAGTRVAQGIIIPYLITEDDAAHGGREGGIGSTGV